jgi:hypothetical protein
MKRTGIIIVAIGLFILAQIAQADWTPAKRLTWTLGASVDPSISIDSNNTIHVVWTDFTPDTEGEKADIYYKRSADGGATWSATRWLTWNSGDSSNTSIDIDSNNTIHVVWQDNTPGNYEIYYKRSADGGATWSAAKRLTWTSGRSMEPAIGIESNNTIHLVWSDDTPGNEEIYYKRSTDGGITWSASKRLTWDYSYSYEAAIAIDSSNTIHAVWRNSSSPNAIYYERSADGGATWGSIKRLTWSSVGSISPAIAIDSSNSIHIVWMDYAPGYPQIYYKKSTDGGASWSAAQRLNWTSSSSYYPAIAIDLTNTIHVVWQDYPSGNQEIYYKRSTDGGTIWSAVKRLTWTSGQSYYPAIAIDSGSTIHVVWSDNTPGNEEIYYMKGK